jgi:hypothetical protein
MKTIGGLACVILGLAGTARAASATSTTSAAEAPEAVAGFALVIGVNRGVDSDSVALRYADDDAVRFRTLFATVGMKTWALARLDENTRRLNPEVGDQLPPPRLAQLHEVVRQVAAAVAAAKAAGKKTVLYLAYAGHGKAEGDSGYIMLEDARLRGPDLLSEIIDPVAASATHVVVDACHSYYAVLGRGPGGSRRPLNAGFSQLGGIALRTDVGLLLSTSSARESHEWAAFQAGVFSHEVRSGLYGAADADGNGQVSYLEIASFVDQANVSVPNEQFRPEVYARAPDGAATLLDLRASTAARIEVDGAFRGHQYVEDSTGVRWADFHNGGNLRLLRPSSARLYLRRAAEDREQVLAEGSGSAVVHTAALPVQDSHVAARGAANDLFRSLFALPFTPEVIASYQARDPGPPAEGLRDRLEGRSGARLGVVAGLGTAAMVSAVAGAVVLQGARSLRNDPAASSTQLTTAATNERIVRRNRWAAALLGAGGAAAVGAALVWLLGDGTPVSSVDVAVGPLGATAGLRGSF